MKIMSCLWFDLVYGEQKIYASNFCTVTTNTYSKWAPLSQSERLQWNLVNSTSNNSKTYLTQTKFHGPCLGNDNWLGISHTFSHNSNWKLRLVPSNYLFCDWICLHSCVTSLISLFSSRERKMSQILEILARKWNTLKLNRLTTVATWLKQRRA